jgi:hypothetical protein
VPQNQHAKVFYLAVAPQDNGGGVSAERDDGELSSDGLFGFFGGSENLFLWYENSIFAVLRIVLIYFNVFIWSSHLAAVICDRSKARFVAIGRDDYIRYSKTRSHQGPRRM